MNVMTTTKLKSKPPPEKDGSYLDKVLAELKLPNNIQQFPQIPKRTPPSPSPENLSHMEN